MKYINTPNLPDGPVTLAVVDGRIKENMEEKLLSFGIKLVKTRKYSAVYEAISYHPDIILNHIGGNSIVYAPGTDNNFLKELAELGFQLIIGETFLKDKYPGNIAYNAARVGDYVFHNKKYIDPVLMNELKKRDIELLHVNQGYAKCSIAIVNEKLIITADSGIARVAERKGIETLLIEQDENILLPGMKRGFIGGSSGLINNHTLAVTGNFDSLKSSEKIRKYLNKNGIKPVSLSDEITMDIGSILPLQIK